MRNWFGKTVTLSSAAVAPAMGELLEPEDLQHAAQPIPQRRIPKDILDNLRSWDRIARVLRITFILLGSMATVSGLIATTFTRDLPWYWVKICTCSAAASIGLLTAFDISGKANAMRRACRSLRAAIMLYQFDATFTIADLINQYRKDQELVGDVNYIPQRAGEPRKSRQAPR